MMKGWPGDTNSMMVSCASCPFALRATWPSNAMSTTPPCPLREKEHCRRRIHGGARRGKAALNSPSAPMQTAEGARGRRSEACNGIRTLQTKQRPAGQLTTIIYRFGSFSRPLAALSKRPCHEDIPWQTTNAICWKHQKPSRHLLNTKSPLRTGLKASKATSGQTTMFRSAIRPIGRRIRILRKRHGNLLKLNSNLKVGVRVSGGFTTVFTVSSPLRRCSFGLKVRNRIASQLRNDGVDIAINI